MFGGAMFGGVSMLQEMTLCAIKKNLESVVMFTRAASGRRVSTNGWFALEDCTNRTSERPRPMDGGVGASDGINTVYAAFL